MLDPGILRNNDKKDAAMALRAWDLINMAVRLEADCLGVQVLNEITEKILNNPNDPKYQRLKINSEKMRQHIMPRKGTVEFLQKVWFC